MCGIAGGLGKARRDVLPALAHRGPDSQDVVEVGPFWLAHTRLAIQDPTSRSDQPFRRGKIVLVYNGELWNRDELRAVLERAGESFETTGDTEVVAAALDRWGPEALPRLRGMFAVGWTNGELLWVARDRHGEVPLHVGRPACFASELGALQVLLGRKGGSWLEPGLLAEISSTGDVVVRRWHRLGGVPTAEGEAGAVRRGLERGTADRTISDVPVCTLLSGGIDSAAIAALLVREFPKIVAYTAVFDPKAQDLRAAREVADFLEIELREVEVPEPTPEGLAGVVRAIEMPDKPQVEIGWACLALARRIRADGFRVTYSGEGSDELWGSYGFAFRGIARLGFGEYRRRLVRDQHRKNFARANKVFMRHGVECRLPFLDQDLVSTALGLTREQVTRGRPDSPASRKVVLQDAVEDLLPGRIVRRSKVAFQDGCGLKRACESVVANPQRFYRAEHRSAFG